METPKKKRASLRDHRQEIEGWVGEGNSDEWIAEKLGTSTSSVQSFRSRNGISRRKRPTNAEKRTVPQEGAVSTFEGVLDHGEHDGWGMWFDPEVAEDPLWREVWQRVDSVRVRLREDAIVLEPQEESEAPASEKPELPTESEASTQDTSGEEDNVERGTLKWFDAEKGYGFIKRPRGDDAFVHHSEVEADPEILSPGQEVVYEVGENERGPVARKVHAP